MFTEAFFAESCSLMRAIAALDGVSAPSLSGLPLNASASSASGSVSCITAEQALVLSNTPAASDEATVFQHLLPRRLDLPRNQTTVLTFSPAFNIFSTRSKELVDKVRATRGGWGWASG